MIQPENEKLATFFKMHFVNNFNKEKQTYRQVGRKNFAILHFIKQFKHFQ